MLKHVPQGEGATQALKQYVFSRERLVRDGVRTKNQLKAVYRGRGILQKAGQSLYSQQRREYWLSCLDSLPAHLARAWKLFELLDVTNELIQEAEADMIQCARRLVSWRLVKTVPGIGRVRVAEMVAKVVTPYRFRTKHEFWQYCGLGVVSFRTNLPFSFASLRLGVFALKGGWRIESDYKPMTIWPQLGQVALTLAGSWLLQYAQLKVPSGLRIAGFSSIA